MALNDRSRPLSARPVTRMRSTSMRLHPRRRWHRISWWYSLILLVPVLLLFADVLFGLGPERGDPRLTIRVSDQTTGKSIAGAVVRVAGVTRETGENGQAAFDAPVEKVAIEVSANGYLSIIGEAGAGTAEIQAVALQPQGAESATGVPDVAPSEVSVVAVDQTAVAPEEAPGIVAAAGTVVDGDGNPVRGALVRAGRDITRTRADGSFSLEDADVSNGIVVSASGYAKQTLPAGTDLTVSMVRQDIKALYLYGPMAGDPKVVDGLIDLINSTEANAIVIDIKDGSVLYDTKVEFFREAKAVVPVYDPVALVKKFKDNGIYTIARQVVFKDPTVAEFHHELAVQDDKSDDVWRGYQGEAWVNPFKRELWQPNIDLAIEAAGFGFDEIQYDYIRFPSDGDLRRADFGPGYTEEGRVDAIVAFLKESRRQLAPLGVMLAVDIFGIVTIFPDDQGIGQRTADIARVVDYVCPMVYPSHFGEGTIPVDGEPNAFPYETIEYTTALALQKMKGHELKFRPWLQDFTYGEPDYLAPEVQAQMDAAMDGGATGWMLWNAFSEFTEDALRPEE